MNMPVSLDSAGSAFADLVAQRVVAILKKEALVVAKPDAQSHPAFDSDPEPEAPEAPEAGTEDAEDVKELSSAEVLDRLRKSRAEFGPGPVTAALRQFGKVFSDVKAEDYHALLVALDAEEPTKPDPED